MANATAMENSLLNHSFDDFNVVEFSNVDDAILMSLLEDSQADEYGDDERLRFVIQSLEAEIISQQETYESDGYGFCGVEQLDSCSTSSDNHLGFEWIDMEMDYASYNDEFSNYFTDKIESMSGLGGMGDYSHVCYEIPMEEENCGGLWQ